VRLASFHTDGKDRVGCLSKNGRLVDLADLRSLRNAPDDMTALIRMGQPILTEIRAGIESWDGPSYDPDAVEWHPPVRHPSKIVCLALNNRSLDKIKIKAPTDHPAFFLKPATALTGHKTAIRMKPCFGFTHPEPEIAVVIGSRLCDATPDEAIAAVFGYSILNDVTCVGMREEDSFSLRYFRPDPNTGEMVESVAHTTYPGRYKASDTFAPMGPYLVTPDEVPDPSDLTIKCLMDDRLVASDHSANYVWRVADALAHISQTMTLLPGDIVSMGTAVGGNQDDPSAPHIPGVTRCNINGYAGEIRIEIQRLGTLVNTVSTLGDNHPS
jgi:2-keto-4-pentenoate hydratase/2-oxohepta-3-ene-1,7-dioic acid hydratase in catechol pathway